MKPMLFDFLNEYLSIIIFLAIALILSIGFIFINFVFSPKNPDPENYQHMNVGLRPLMTQEWNLM